MYRTTPHTQENAAQDAYFKGPKPLVHAPFVGLSV